MEIVDRIVAAIRHWPYAIEHGTYHHLFERRDDLREQADGPPIYEGGGFVFRPTGELLTAEQYRDVCEHLSTPQKPGDTPDERARARSQRQRFGRVLSAEDRRRNRIRGKAHDGEGRRYV